MLHRPLIDAIEFARAGSKLSGEWPVADLPRIEGGEHPDRGVLHFELQGVPLEQGRPALRLHVTGVLNLTCQRCLGALEHPLCVEALLMLYASEQDIAEGPVESEGPDRIVASQYLAVRELIEDEVLLALPYAPRHERCEARPRAEAAPRQRPFADLRALLNTKHQDAFQQDDAGHPARRMIFNKEPTMAVPQNRKTPSKRGMHRSHDALSGPPLAVEPTTGEVHLRHHISPTGYYRGKKVAKGKGD